MAKDAKYAYKHKGMKAPRPAGYGEMSQSKAPKVKPSMMHKEPEGPFKFPKQGEQKAKLEHKKKALPQKDAPEGVKGVNEGMEYSLPKSGGRGEGEV